MKTIERFNPKKARANPIPKRKLRTISFTNLPKKSFGYKPSITPLPQTIKRVSLLLQRLDLIESKLDLMDSKISLIIKMLKLR